MKCSSGGEEVRPDHSGREYRDHDRDSDGDAGDGDRPRELPPSAQRRDHPRRLQLAQHPHFPPCRGLIRYIFKFLEQVNRINRIS